MGDREASKEEFRMQLSIGRPTTIESLQVQLVQARELKLTGTISTKTAQEELSRLILQFHEHVVAERHPSITVDVRTLNFVNSSVIRVFVTWIARAEQGHYKLVFLTDQGVTWHRLSFSVLKSLSPTTVEIREGSMSRSPSP
jgi:anti-anti-sigma regulatory factor